MATDRIQVSRLTELELVIRDGLRTFVEVGRALMEIRDGGLYKPAFSTFGDYCVVRWHMDRSRAYQQIDAANIHEIVSTSVGAEPKSEWVIRPLVPIYRDYRDQLPAVWDAAVKRAPVGEDGEPIITAKHVESIVAEFLPREAVIVPGNGCTVADLHQLVAAGKRFGTIYADPPWQYGNQATRSATDNEYPTVSVDWLCDPANMPIEALAADEAHLHLWTTNAFLFDAKRLIEAWGFEYKSCFVWVKPTMGIGNYWRVSHEFLLLGVRGGLTFLDRGKMSWRELPRTKHSEKPDQIRQDIEATSPPERIELFARVKSPGWWCWGNEIERTLLSA